MSSVIHKWVFTPSQDLPTQIIETIDNSSNSTIPFEYKKKKKKKKRIFCESFIHSILISCSLIGSLANTMNTWGVLKMYPAQNIYCLCLILGTCWSRHVLTVCFLFNQKKTSATKNKQANKNVHEQNIPFTKGCSTFNFK